MAHKPTHYCLASSLLLVFMLLYQAGVAQCNFTTLDGWLNNILSELGGRAVMLVYKDGKISYSKSINDLNRGQKFSGKMVARKKGRTAEEVLKNFDVTSRIPIAICSKWLSAALVMTFVDEGKSSLQDTIGKFLPIMKENGKGNISIAQCLSHTTGIKAGNFKDDHSFTFKAYNMDETIRSIARQPVEAAPGEAFRYSSTGLQLAAAAIEKIGGKKFETLFAERIAVPSGMTNTDFGHKEVPLAAGGAWATAADYLQFLEMILDNGMYRNNRVLRPESIRMMQQDHTNGKKVIYSPAEAGNLGLRIWGVDHGKSQRSKLIPSRNKSFLFGSFPWVDNQNNYAAVLFTFYLKNKGRNERYGELKKNYRYDHQNGK